jgi:hypothetical protein
MQKAGCRLTARGMPVDQTDELHIDTFLPKYSRFVDKADQKDENDRRVTVHDLPESMIWRAGQIQKSQRFSAW